MTNCFVRKINIPILSLSFPVSELSLTISQMSQYCYRYRSEKIARQWPSQHWGDRDTETR